MQKPPWSSQPTALGTPAPCALPVTHGSLSLAQVPKALSVTQHVKAEPSSTAPSHCPFPTECISIKPHSPQATSTSQSSWSLNGDLTVQARPSSAPSLASLPSRASSGSLPAVCLLLPSSQRLPSMAAICVLSSVLLCHSLGDLCNICAPSKEIPVFPTLACGPSLPHVPSTLSHLFLPLHRQPGPLLHLLVAPASSLPLPFSKLPSVPQD